MEDMEKRIVIYNQMWTHARHIEDERFKFMSVHFAVLGALYYAAYIYNLDGVQIEIHQLRIFAISTGILLTLITLALTLKFEFLFRSYTKQAQQIIQSHTIPESREPNAPYLIRLISIHKIFPIFYFISIYFQLLLLSHEISLPEGTQLWLMSILGALWFLFIVFFYLGRMPGISKAYYSSDAK